MQKAIFALVVPVLVGCGQAADNRREALAQTETPILSAPPAAATAVDCNEIKRPLNPSEKPLSEGKEQELDKHFRIAFYHETAGEFDRAIEHYRAAAKLAVCECDRAHAAAGVKAATEAAELLQRAGMDAKPTQFFWGRLQDLTQDLPCVDIH